MKKWLFRTVCACAVVALLGFVALLAMHWLYPEPAIQGRPLSHWLAQLQDRDAAKRVEASKALSSMGPEAVPYLTGELTRGPGPMQKAAHAASRFLPRWAKAGLQRIYRPPDELAKKHLLLHAVSLMGTNAAAAAPAVGELLRQPDVGLASAAAGALIHLGTNSVPELIAALDDGDYNVRSHACYALANLRTNAAAAVPRLAQILLEERGAIAASAVMTLGRIGEPAVPLLESLLEQTNAVVRQWAAMALGQVHPPASSALPGLMKVANDPIPAVRGAALSAIAGIDVTSQESASLLLGALRDPDPDVRKIAAQASFIRPRLVRENQELFRDLLQDENQEVRAAAAKAVGQTGRHGAWAIPLLQAWIEGGETETNSVTRIAAIHALNTITNSAVSKPLSEPGLQIQPH